MVTNYRKGERKMNFAAEWLLADCTGYSPARLSEAARAQTILQSTALLYDAEGCLHFCLGGIPAVMPHAECADGLADGSVREIAVLSRVGRPACFVITAVRGGFAPSLVLSRARAQRRCRAEYLDRLRPGDIIPCTATRLETFGVFCDVGCGISALLPIDCLSVSRIASPADRVQAGQQLRCAVRQRDERGRLVLTMKELLGSWEQNAALFEAGMTVVGTVRSVEEYGVFIELTPNLAGLAEYSDGLAPGDAVSVYIKSVLPEKMKIKLVVLSRLPPAAAPAPLHLFVREGHLDEWTYSCPGAQRTVRTVFAVPKKPRGG